MDDSVRFDIMIPKIDIEQYTTQPIEETLSSYPTLLDVLESIAAQEENALAAVQPMSQTKMPDWLYYLNQVGHCQLIQCNGMPVLMPMGKRFGVYYRGESKYHKECLPSLWREKDKEKQEKERILSYMQTAEMIVVMKQHPVIRHIENTPIHINLSSGPIEVYVPIQYDGLAQHYGIKTRYLDLTTDKWSAAFFAATDYRDGEYLIHKTSADDKIENKFGTFYVLQLPPRDDMLTDFSVFPIGQQYFNRPGCQSALVMDMRKYRDLNKCPIAKKIFFRHDNTVSEQVYYLSQRGKRFFPDDSLQKVVEQITANPSLEFSEKAFELCWRIYYPKMSLDAVKTLVQGIGIKIVSTFPFGFDAKEVARDKEKWDKGGSARYLDSIHMMDIMPVPNNLIIVK